VVSFIYEHSACSLAAVEALAGFMKEFERKNG